MPNCWTMAELPLAPAPPLPTNPSKLEEGRRSLDKGVGVGEGEGEEFSRSRAEAPSLASCATNMAKDSSSAYGEAELLRMDAGREEDDACRGSEFKGGSVAVVVVEVEAGGGRDGGSGWEAMSMSSSESSSSISSLACREGGLTLEHTHTGTTQN